MPLITDIKRQQRNQQVYSIYIDNRYAFSLSDLDLSNAGLRSGQELSDDNVGYWQSQAHEAKAYNAALRQLASRRRSRRELTDYLRRKDYDADTIASVLERLEQARLVDDQAFAAAWIADRQLLRPRSRRALEGELLQKGIACDIITDALADISSESQLETLVDLAQRKHRQSQYADRQKLTAYLARQGYSYGLIKQALERLE